MEKHEEIKKILAELLEALPPVVFRNWRKWKDVLPISPRTIANEDSRGTGPRHKIRVGHVTGYPREALVEWLQERTRVIC